MTSEVENLKSTNRILIVVLIIAAFFLGSLTNKVSSTQKPITETTQIPDIQPTAQPSKTDVDDGHLPVLGNKDAKVTLVEFSDFQCLYCRRLWKDTLPQLKKEYIDTGKIKFTYRHFPLPALHPQAQITAEASECANEQNKFWEFHDKAFEEQAKQGEGTISYTKDDIISWAQTIELDMSQFNSCLDSGKYTKNVQEDIDAGTKAGVSGTPAIFVNGQLIVGAQPFESFKATIDPLL